MLFNLNSRKPPMRHAAGVLATLLANLPLLAQPQHIATTEPLPPEKAAAAFTVPAGFEVQLVASEPQIEKPIQCAFDAKGRLWVTTTRHYPFAAPIGKGTDKLFVLSDFGPDGKARKVEAFANDLNIPIGILPLPDCNSCIVHSIPSIWKYTDTDGDGKADAKEELLTGFGTEDTHGMVNSFTLTPDGWVYATHGFKNTSVVKDKKGHTITMNSGNTFRFRPDGSNLEQFTIGQVNPFGIAIDPWFNLYTADCHSKPITQLIRGATYISFAKPHQGLGFAPHVTEHSHNSTAICGLAWYDADHYPAEYKGRMFLGNVVTNRVNADLIEWKGSTPVAKEMPDFLVSKDPWFRPIDVKLGPDGALYVTDFYNRIIGHYEVPLTHPQRDKDHGRVWRVVWKGKKPEMPFADLTKEKGERVDELLGHPNLTVRLLATQEMIRREEQFKAVERDSKLYEVHRRWANAARVWRGILSESKEAIGSDPFIEAHVERIHTAREEWDREKPNREQIQHAKDVLAGVDPQVARAGVDYMTAFPEASNIPELVKLLKSLPIQDTHLRYAARVALRNSVMADGGWAAASGPDSVQLVGSIALGIPTKESAAFLFKTTRNPTEEVAEFIGRYGTSNEWGRMFDHGISDSEPRLPRLKVLTALLRGIQTGKPADIGSVDNDARVLVLNALNQTAELAVARQALQMVMLLEKLPSSEMQRDGRRTTLSEPTWKWVMNASADLETRAEAFEVAASYYFDPLQQKIRTALLEDKLPPHVLVKGAAGLSANPKALAMKPVRDALRGVFKSISYREAVALALNLAANRDGADVIFIALEQGLAPARLLQEKPILDRLKESKVNDFDVRVAALTKNLPPVEQRINDLIGQRSRAFLKAKTDSKHGAELFSKHCAACHQINGVGGKVGPNLDGIGTRGAERLLEDILDPNRNVDGAFRSRTLTLADGRTVRGLLLRVEGAVLVMANEEGKEVRVPEDDVEKNIVTNLSPMPANVDTALPQKEFLNLLAYLLDQKPK